MKINERFYNILAVCDDMDIHDYSRDNKYTYDEMEQYAYANRSMFFSDIHGFYRNLVEKYSDEVNLEIFDKLYNCIPLKERSNMKYYIRNIVLLSTADGVDTFDQDILVDYIIHKKWASKDVTKMAINLFTQSTEEWFDNDAERWNEDVAELVDGLDTCPLDRLKCFIETDILLYDEILLEMLKIWKQPDAYDAHFYYIKDVVEKLFDHDYIESCEILEHDAIWDSILSLLSHWKRPDIIKKAIKYLSCDTFIRSLDSMEHLPKLSMQSVLGTLTSKLLRIINYNNIDILRSLHDENICTVEMICSMYPSSIEESNFVIFISQYSKWFLSDNRMCDANILDHRDIEKMRKNCLNLMPIFENKLLESQTIQEYSEIIRDAINNHHASSKYDDDTYNQMVLDLVKSTKIDVYGVIDDIPTYITQSICDVMTKCISREYNLENISDNIGKIFTTSIAYDITYFYNHIFQKGIQMSHVDMFKNLSYLERFYDDDYFVKSGDLLYVFGRPSLQKVYTDFVKSFNKGFCDTIKLNVIAKVLITLCLLTVNYAKNNIENIYKMMEQEC